MMTATTTTTTTAATLPAGPVLFFDGVCNLCSSTVQFILEHEAGPTLQFASLQSDLAAAVLPGLGIDPSDLDSVVLVEGGAAFEKSSAALRIAKKLKAPWSWLGVFLVVPRFLRNFAYDLVAKNRYRVWGKKDACWMPTPALKARFL